MTPDPVMLRMSREECDSIVYALDNAGDVLRCNFDPVRDKVRTAMERPPVARLVEISDGLGRHWAVESCHLSEAGARASAAKWSAKGFMTRVSAIEVRE